MLVMSLMGLFLFKPFGKSFVGIYTVYCKVGVETYSSHGFQSWKYIDNEIYK